MIDLLFCRSINYSEHRQEHIQTLQSVSQCHLSVDPSLRGRTSSFTHSCSPECCVQVVGGRVKCEKSSVGVVHNQSTVTEPG